jgi:hypothetical protein
MTDEANPVAEGELIDAPSRGFVLTARDRVELDVQINTAKRYMRSVKTFKAQCLELATLDEETAGTMFYVLPRGAKKIDGPSIRLAEVVGSAWGNLRYGARIVEEGEKFVVAQGACHDLQNNNAVTVDIRRRITDGKGRRFNDDMIQVTANAACSIALRQAIFKIVPFALIKDVYEAARQCSVGKAMSMTDRRQAAIGWFSKVGVSEKQVVAYLGREGIEDITLDDLIDLRGLVTAIRDGDMSVETALGTDKQPGARVSRSELNESLVGDDPAVRKIKTPEKNEAPPPRSKPKAMAPSLPLDVDWPGWISKQRAIVQQAAQLLDKVETSENVEDVMSTIARMYEDKELTKLEFDGLRDYAATKLTDA